MASTVRRAGLGLAVGLVASLLAASAATAYGPCGVDINGPSACPIASSPASASGSIASRDEKDYYVFYARPHTHFSVTVNDTEDPNCYLNYDCSAVTAYVYNTRGVLVTSSHSSQPQVGIPQPQSLSATLRGGTYYVVIGGVPDTANPVPYTFTVNPATSPAVQWPPPCIVPRLPHGTSLRHAEAILVRSHCAVGRVTRRHDRHTRSGKVLGLRPRAGSTEPYGAKINILLSRGR